MKFTKTDPIPGIIGRGVTAIGAESPRFSNIFQEQVAISVCTEKPFWGCFKVNRSEVLIHRKNHADYKQTEERTKAHINEGLFVERNKCRIEPKTLIKELKVLPPSSSYYNDDLIEFLDSFIDKHPEAGLVVPGHLDDIRFLTGNFIKIALGLGNDKKVDWGNPLGANYSINERDRMNINSLRDFSLKNDIAILIAADTGSKGKFNAQYGRGAFFCDNQLLLKEGKDNKWTLKLQGEYIPSDIYNLTYNPYTHFQLEEGELMKIKGLDLNENERKIIDLLWDKGSMKLFEIERETKIKHASVDQRLKALQTEKKGCWIIRTGMTYQVDKSKERPWFDEAGGKVT